MATYIAIAALGCAAIVAVALVHLGERDVPALIVLAGIAIVAERIVVRLPRDGALAPSMTVYTAVFLLCPLPVAVLVPFLGMLGGEIIGRKVWFKVVFNVALMTISVGAAAALWRVTAGSDVADAPALLSRLHWAFLAGLVFYVLNTTLLSTAVSLSRGERLWEIWRANHHSGLLPHFGMQAIGVLVAQAWLLSAYSMVLLAIPAVVTWASFRQIRELESTTASERVLRESSDRHAARWAAMATITDRLSSTFDVPAIYQTAADLAIRFWAQDARIVSSDGQQVLAQAHRLGVDAVAVSAEDARSFTLDGGRKVFGTLWATRDPARADLYGDDLMESLIERVSMVLDRATLVQQTAEIETLRELARLKGEFLATVGHELHTPISVVIGYGELLQQQDATSAQAHWMGDRILRAGQRLSRLVDDLLDAGRLESGRFTLDRKHICPRAAVEDAIEATRASRSEQKVMLDIPASLPAADGDPARVQQVLVNLLSNAGRYGRPDGSIWIRVEHDGSEVAFAVEDDGKGVPPNERELIFEKFYRSPRDEQRARRGLGLGLAIAQDIVKAHGGRMWVEESAAGGARFVFTLPSALALVGNVK